MWACVRPRGIFMTTLLDWLWEPEICHVMGRHDGSLGKTRANLFNFYKRELGYLLGGLQLFQKTLAAPLFFTHPVLHLGLEAHRKHSGIVLTVMDWPLNHHQSLNQFAQFIAVS